jgi:branched-chain amino acid transport system permease protein
VFFLLAVLFGGGTILGPVIGAVSLCCCPRCCTISTKYRLIVYACLILPLYFLPNGVSGLATRRGKPQGATDTQDSGDDQTAVTMPVVSGAELQIENVSRAFGGLIALADVSVRVAAGSIHALIGPNGAGKTTLINIVSGTYRADSGRINVDGTDAEITSMHMAARQGIVRTFQTLKLFGNMTVIEHVMVGMARHSRPAVGCPGQLAPWQDGRQLCGQSAMPLRISHHDGLPRRRWLWASPRRNPARARLDLARC